MTKKISSAQMRAARAMLRWTALDLAAASKVGVATIRRVEVVDGEIPVTLANEAAIRRAFEAAAISEPGRADRLESHGSRRELPQYPSGALSLFHVSRTGTLVPKRWTV